MEKQIAVVTNVNAALFIKIIDVPLKIDALREILFQAQNNFLFFVSQGARIFAVNRRECAVDFIILSADINRHVVEINFVE